MGEPLPGALRCVVACDTVLMEENPLLLCLKELRSLGRGALLSKLVQLKASESA
ncbi:MAG TPA: hypothetical protein VFE34_23920 [Dongiaceae bacterium]|jgi:hypothetical protein|nr:hypothetical protein [Dongiaceae bacterium]